MDYSSITSLIAAAIREPIEITASELAGVPGLQGDAIFDRLSAANLLLLEQGLEIHPPLYEGEHNTPRVIRDAAVATNSELLEKLVSEGESHSIEFKSSMFVSLRDWTKSQEIVIFPGLVGEVLKTVCAFLNTGGGHLLIGVDDDGVPCEGVKLDLGAKGWSQDRYLLNLGSTIAGRFYEGKGVQPFVRAAAITWEGFPVVHVRVTGRHDPAFVRRENQYEYFVRSGPKSESLDLPSFYQHLRGGSLRP